MEKRFLPNCLTVQIDWTVSMNVAASCSAEGRKLRTPGALRLNGFQVLRSSCCPVLSGVVLYRPVWFAACLQTILAFANTHANGSVCQKCWNMCLSLQVRFRRIV